MYKITVEGVYESDTGSGQRQYEGYSYDLNISKPTIRGIMTHIQKRFIPYLISKDKTKTSKIFSRLRTCVITNTQIIDDKKSIIGKDIRELNEWEIQDLACLFDLYEVPIPQTCSISEMRDKAIIEYMKVVLKVPMRTPQERSQLDFIKQSSDGTYKLDLKRKVLVKVPTGYFEKKKKEIEKKSLAFFESLIDSFTGDKEDKEKTPESDSGNTPQSDKGNDGFPSADSLLN